MQYETITMPDAGIGSFLTSNMDEIDDNILMFGNAGGINSMKEVADRMAKMGREGDTFVIHASEKEVMVPREVAENNPELVGQIKEAIAAEGADPEAYVVGSDRNSINPMTGQREFFLKKLVRGVKKVFKKAAKIILPVAINALVPGLGTIASAAIGAGIGGLIQGESFGDALKSAALGGITAGVASGISGALGSIGTPQTLGQGFMTGLKGGLPASYSGSGLKGAFPSASDFALRKAGDPLFMGTGFAGTEAFENLVSGQRAVAPVQNLYEQASLEKANALKSGIELSDEAALKIVTDKTAAAAGSGSFLKNAALYGGLGLGATALAGGFDPIPAEDIDLTDLGINVGGDGTGDLSTNPLASSTDVYNQNPGAYSVGQPGATRFFSLADTMVPSSALYGSNQGTIANIYSNLVPTGAGTNIVTPLATTSGSTATPEEIAEVRLAGFNPNVTGMMPTELYGIDALGRPVLSAYDLADVIMPARFVGSNEEVRTAASGGAMNFPRRTGQIEGPGTETSDDIPAMLSDGEFVMTAKAVKGAGNGSREQGFRKMYDIMRSFEGGAVA